MRIIDDLIFKYKMMPKKEQQKIKNRLRILAIVIILLSANRIAYASDDFTAYLRSLGYSDENIKILLNSLTEQQKKEILEFAKNNFEKEGLRLAADLELSVYMAKKLIEDIFKGANCLVANSAKFSLTTATLLKIIQMLFRGGCIWLQKKTLQY